jgi:glycosyltransferase involved in cell wall biosynthesis
MKRVLFVHQSADLYGSDRVLLTVVRGLDRSRITPVVMLPRTGPLYDALVADGVDTRVLPLVTVARRTFSPRGIAKLPAAALTSLRRMARELEGVRVDAVHSNTFAVLSGALWARLRGIPHVWHVHEMITHPRIVAHGFPWLLSHFADQVVCCSGATRELLLAHRRDLAHKTRVIANGVTRPPPRPTDRARVRSRLGVADGEVMVLVAGRLTELKGHRVFVDAAARLRHHDRLRFVIVGDPPAGGEPFERALHQQIRDLGVDDKLRVLPFEQDIWPYWDACDIAVVPTIGVESFGLVAVEAMLARKPVIAAARGGLLEIVTPDSGVLVPPADASTLATEIASLADAPARRAALGHAGYERATELFSEQRFVAGFQRFYQEVLA